MSNGHVQLPDRLPDNWRRIIEDHVHRVRPFCARAMYADLRDTPPKDDAENGQPQRPYYGAPAVQGKRG